MGGFWDKIKGTPIERQSVRIEAHKDNDLYVQRVQLDRFEFPSRTSFLLACARWLKVSKTEIDVDNLISLHNADEIYGDTSHFENAFEVNSRIRKQTFQHIKQGYVKRD